MSDIEDRRFKVTWRTVTQTIGAVEAIKERRITAAYYRRDDDRFVFKRADGLQAFDVAAHLVETIEVLDDEIATVAS